MLDIQTVNLADLVPENLKEDPKVSAAIESINGELSEVSRLCVVPAIFSRIDELSSGQLDHLAWQFNSKVWRDTWPINLKRSVIRSVIQEKSRKGTRYAVIQALEALGSAASVREWWQTCPRGIPHTFDVTLTVSDLPGQSTAETQKDLILQLDNSKPARSNYNLNLALNGEGKIGALSAARPAIYARIQAREAP